MKNNNMEEAKIAAGAEEEFTRLTRLITTFELQLLAIDESVDKQEAELWAINDGHDPNPNTGKWIAWVAAATRGLEKIQKLKSIQKWLFAIIDSLKERRAKGALLHILHTRLPEGIRNNNDVLDLIARASL